MRVRRAPDAGLSLAGWVFADLMLALAIIGLAIGVPPQSRVGSRDAETTSVRTVASMQRQPFVTSVRVDTDGLRAGRGSAQRTLRASITNRVRQLAVANRRAAMVIVWGHAPRDDVGMDVAMRAARQLGNTNKRLFSSASTRAFWRHGAINRVTLEIYLYKQQGVSS